MTKRYLFSSLLNEMMKTDKSDINVHTPQTKVGDVTCCHIVSVSFQNRHYREEISKWPHVHEMRSLILLIGGFVALVTD